MAGIKGICLQLRIRNLSQLHIHTTGTVGDQVDIADPTASFPISSFCLIGRNGSSP